MTKNYEMDLTHGPLLKKIILFSLPLMFTSMLQLLYNAADVVVVGAFAGDQSLAAVGSTGSITNLIVNLFMGMATGTGVIVAQSIGARDRERLYKTVHTSMLVSVILGVFISIFGVLSSHFVLTLMKSPPDVIDKATLYMRIYFLGTPALMVYNFGAAIIRSAGDTKRPLIILGLSGIVNVVLNLIFVIIFHMDVAGVAIATIISQYLSAIAIVLKLMHDDADYKLFLSDLKIYKQELLGVLKYGVPMGLQNSMFSLSNVIIQSSINSFGTFVVAGNAAESSINAFVLAACDSGAQAAITFSGQNAGAKKFDRVKKSMVLCVFLTSVLGLVVGMIAFIFKVPLLSLYTDTPESIAAGVEKMNILCPIYFTCGIMHTIGNTVRGMGKSVMPMITTMFFVCIFRILWILTILPVYNTPSSIYISYPISWVLAIVAHFIYFLFVFHRQKKLA